MISGIITLIFLSIKNVEETYALLISSLFVYPNKLAATKFICKI